MAVQRGNSLIILVVTTALILSIVFYFIANKEIATKSSPAQTMLLPPPAPSATTIAEPGKTKLFRSSNVMDFSIILPNNLEAIEKFGDVTINTPDGNIYIGRIATNYDNLKDYLKDLERENDSPIQNKQDITINKLSATKGIVNNQDYYFIYSNYSVYTLFTPIKDLQNDLDQIAQSFQYTP